MLPTLRFAVQCTVKCIHLSVGFES